MTLAHLDALPHLHPEAIPALIVGGLIIWGIKNFLDKKKRKKTA